MFATIKGYLYLAAVLGILAAIGAVYAKGQLDARHAVETAALKATIATMQAQRDADIAAAKLDTIQAKLDAEDMAALADRAQALQEKLDAPGTECFTPHDTDLLRDYWGAQPPTHPTRH